MTGVSRVRLLRAPTLRRKGFGIFALAGGALCVACGTNGDLSLGRFPELNASLETDELGAGGAGTSGGATGEGATGEPGTNDPLGGAGGALPACSVGAPLPVPAHRYDFSGSGTTLVDRNGGLDGEILGGATLDGSGELVLSGDPEYVDLPNDILGTEQSVSVLLWVRMESGPAYWRIFDFGTSSDGEDPPAGEHTVGSDYIALTPETGLEPNGLALLIGHGGPASEERALSSVQIEDRPVALAVVLDGSIDRGSSFVDGSVVAETPLSGSLSDIDTVNNWLGRSQYSADPYARGSYDEVRIYHVALSACEVSALVARGPNDAGP